MSTITKLKFQNNRKIKSWKKFARLVRSNGCDLLSRIDEFPNSVLISGCQRSGGTMLSRIISSSDHIVNFSWGSDEELDAALILSGYVDMPIHGRFCFQTTYLNECYKEYYSHASSSYKLVWLVRNPYSVVYSLLHNWSRFALNELFNGCGSTLLTREEKRKYERFGIMAISRLKRACYSYNAKVSQIFDIREKLGVNRVLVIEYDNLVRMKEKILPLIFNFVDLEYKDIYGSQIRTSSLMKADRLSTRERDLIAQFCVPVYEKAKLLCMSS